VWVLCRGAELSEVLRSVRGMAMVDAGSAQSLGDALESARASLSVAAAAPVWMVGDSRLAELVAEAAEVVARAQAVLLRLVGEADAREALVGQGAPSSAAWLRQRARLAPAEASTYVRTARALRSELAGTRAACADGRVSLAQAAVIARAVAELPAEPSLRAAAEQRLVADAAAYDPVLLSRVGRHLVAVADPDGADGRDGDALARAEERAGRRLELSLTADGEGGAWLRGRLDAEGAAVVRAALDPLSRPLPSAADGPDPRSPARRRAEALVELCRRALSGGGLPDSGGDRPQLVVTVPLRTLAAGVGTATLDDGTVMSATTARRLACDAAVLPAVLGGAGQVLDVGRSRRLFTGPLRRALVLRDRGCAFPGCDRPPSWCEAHHLRHWADGGTTSLDNGVLLCAHHHRLVERGDWTVRLATDGVPDFHPPPWIDPARRPLRNHLHPRPG